MTPLAARELIQEFLEEREAEASDLITKVEDLEHYDIQFDLCWLLADAGFFRAVAGDFRRSF